MIAMTRQLTKRELVLAATSLVRMPIGRTHRNEFLVKFVAINACRGIVLGILLAVLVLATDAFGISTLISAQPNPMTTVLVFVLVSSFKFVALTIAVAVGLVASSK
jgi:hypothetical protein